MKKNSNAANQLRLSALPSPKTIRWTIRRKAAVVSAVLAGALTLDQACTRYRLSAEEFATWQQLIATHGIEGLRVTRVQEYRQLNNALPAQRRQTALPTVPIGSP